MEKQTKTMSALILIVGLLSLSIIASSPTSEIKDYWIGEGLSEEEATSISLGNATKKTIEKAEAIQLIQLTNETELLIQENDSIAKGFFFLGILGLLAFTSVIVLILLFLGWSSKL